MFLPITLCIVGFSLCDKLLELYNIQGRYYGVHAIANGAIISLTWKNFFDAYLLKNLVLNNMDTLTLYKAKSIIYALHLYHILLYYKKMRFDDWLHHILMLGVSLPLTELVPPTSILGHSMFFINGLPGMIDYTLLFLVRNNHISKYTEKYINRLVNIWIRCPGCIMTTTLIIVNMGMNYNIMSTTQFIASTIMAGCVYWNGIYFMDQVVRDYALTCQ